MIGSIIGDMAASRYISGLPVREEDSLLDDTSEMTDGSLLTLAAAKAIAESEGKEEALGDEMGFWYEEIRAQYGTDEAPEDELSDACFISGPAGLAASTPEEGSNLAACMMRVLDEEEETIQSARLLAELTVLCESGMSKEDIAAQAASESYTLREAMELRQNSGARNLLRENAAACAFAAFLNGTDFKTTVRGALELSGGRPSTAAAAGSLGEAFYGVPEEIEDLVREKLGHDFTEIVDQFNEYVLTAKVKV